MAPLSSDGEVRPPVSDLHDTILQSTISDIVNAVFVMQQQDVVQRARTCTLAGEWAQVVQCLGRLEDSMWTPELYCMRGYAHYRLV